MTPIEGFVVSRIDGSATTQDLADLTSLGPDEVERTLDKLIGLGAVEWADGATALPRASLRPPTPAEPIKRFVPPQAARVPLVEQVEDRDGMPSAVRADGSSSAAGTSARIGLRTPSGERPIDDIELTSERRDRIDQLYPVLDLLDHYELLGVPRDADVKTIRATYFARSKVFHPDTAFRKNLGPYKAKMEAIFTRLTEAYDVLGKKRARAEYDAYLGTQVSLREAEAAIAPPDVGTPESGSPEAGSPEAGSPGTGSPGTGSPATGLAETGSPEPVPPGPGSARTMSEEGKRRARELFQKRLGGPAPSRTPLPAAAAAPVETAPRARQEVLRDLTSSLKGAAARTGGLDPVQRHVLDARRSEQAGDLANAAKELRLAVALAPERFDVTSEQQRVAKLLAAQLADQYATQAAYEERHRKWAAAALSWAKVVEGRPQDATAHSRAAIALLEAKGDLHKAQRLAQRACDLAPDDPAARRTLGRVFLAAGLQLNARRELERAAALDPTDIAVKNLLRDMKG